MQFFQAVDKLNKTTAKSLMEKDNRNNDDVMKLISEHRQTQLELYKLRVAEKKRLDDKLKDKLAKRMTNGADAPDFLAPPPKVTSCKIYTTVYYHHP